MPQHIDRRFHLLENGRIADALFCKASERIEIIVHNCLEHDEMRECLKISALCVFLHRIQHRIFVLFESFKICIAELCDLFVKVAHDFEEQSGICINALADFNDALLLRELCEHRIVIEHLHFGAVDQGFDRNLLVCELAAENHVLEVLTFCLHLIGIGIIRLCKDALLRFLNLPDMR